MIQASDSTHSTSPNTDVYSEAHDLIRHLTGSYDQPLLYTNRQVGHTTNLNITYYDALFKIFDIKALGQNMLYTPYNCQTKGSVVRAIALFSNVPR